jgi:hypothetical protein
MNAQLNELKRTRGQLRGDVVSAAIIVLGVLATVLWDLSAGWLTLRLLNIL